MIRRAARQTMASPLRLATDRVCLVLDVDGVPEILHFGATGVATDGLVSDAPVLPGGEFDEVAPITLVPSAASGFPGRPGIEGRRACGSGHAVAFGEGRVVDNGPRHLHWEGSDPHSLLGLGIAVELDGAGVVTMRATVTNLSDDVYQLQRATVTVPLPERSDELLRFVGRWAHEFQIARIPWPHGTLLIENRRGRTSHDNHPTAVVGADGFGETTGAVVGLHLAWSGNAELRFDPEKPPADD